MAVIVPGSIVADIRGSVGAETYSRTQGGLVVKSKPIPTQTASAKRDQIQANLKAVTQAWSGRLTASQRLAWKLYGHNFPRPNRWGASTITSGYLAYVRCNCALKLLDDTWWIYSPPKLGMLPMPVFTMQFFSGCPMELDIVLDPAYPLENHYFLIISTGKTTNAGVSYYSSPWQIVSTNEYDEGTWTPSLITIEIDAWPGGLARAWVKAFMFDRTTGRISKPFQFTKLVDT